MDDLAGELDWLAEEFESLSEACQSEYGVSENAAMFERDRERAKRVIAALKALIPPTL